MKIEYQEAKGFDNNMYASLLRSIIKNQIACIAAETRAFGYSVSTFSSFLGSIQSDINVGKSKPETSLMMT